MKLTGLIIVLSVILISCKKKQIPDADYAGEMRNFVIGISEFAKASNPNFLIVPQNGADIVTSDFTSTGALETAYIDAIDGIGQEDLFYGYTKDDKETPTEERNYLLPFLNMIKDNAKPVLVTDYVMSQNSVDKSYVENGNMGFLSFAAPDRNLNQIPTYPTPIIGENANDIVNLSDAQNFLYLINPTEKFADLNTFVQAVNQTNYDVLIIDLFFDEEQLTTAELNQLKVKANGGQRLVLCYMSIGEAEDYRYYWKSDWNKRKNRPDWIYKENKNWRGNYKVFYWDTEWQDIIYKGVDSYLGRIIAAGFSGTYLDIIDAYEYYNEIKN